MNDTRLIAYNKDMLQKAISQSDASQITSVRVGAKLFNSIKLNGLVECLALFPALNTVCISDDWVSDDQLNEVTKLLNKAFPNIHVVWAAEGLVAGRHGR